MEIDLIEKIRDLLRKHWKYVYYTDIQIDYEPEFRFFETADYEILARKILLYLSTKPNKRDFIKKATKNLVAEARSYFSNHLLAKFTCKHVAHLLYNLYRARSVEDDTYFQVSYITYSWN